MSVAEDKPTETVDKVEKAKSGGGLWDTFKIVIQALILALLVRTFLFQPFSIPSGSMEDTLLVGDFLFVSKYAYGYSRYSFPFSPDLFEGRFWASEPERGDIIVFKTPLDNTTDYIKRLVGLPGDRIQMIDGVLNINGAPVQMELISEGTGESGFGRITRYRETLPNGVSYEVLDTRNSSADNTQEFVVPEGHYFMMGDNRDNSTDSRFTTNVGGVGYVPFENLIGRAEIIFFSVDPAEGRAWEFWRWPWTVRGERLFRTL